MSEPIATQPSPTASMSTTSRPSPRTVLGRVKHKLTTKDGWLGDFDYGYLCTPQLPFGNLRKRTRAAPFYALDDDLPLGVMLIVGFQHSLAMLAGVITPPIIFASELNLPADMQSYMISASLIASGILSMIQMSRIRIWREYYLGTGLITVVGTSFATLSVASSIFNTLYSNGTCPMVTAEDGTTSRGSCPEAFGYLLGTFMLTSLTEMFLSLVPPQRLKKIFPPIVTGTTVLLIGASLIASSGAPNWGGGSKDCSSRPTSGIFELCPTIFAPKAAAWGSPQFIGLGFLSFITIVLVELFGSPFMRNGSIIIGLIVGCIVAGATGYIDSSSITSSPAITFLWVHRFPLKIYAPAILPGIAVYIALALEAIGDITASSEASRQPVDGSLFNSRIQGGILADGLAGLIAGCFTVTPMSVFAQNNSVIALTKCANRSAGYVCACLLILYGVLGKLSGVFLSIPNPVLGGVTTMLFASVMVSGIRVLSYISWGRKERFVLGASFAFGFSNLLVPGWMDHLFDGVTNVNSGTQGLLDSITIILTTPYLAAFLVGVLLWNVIPEEPQDDIVHTHSELAEQGQLEMLPGKTDVAEDELDDRKVAGSTTSHRVEPVL